MTGPPASGFAGARVLVTGGLGFIGSQLARRLADDGAEVTIADCAEAGSGANPRNVRDIRERVRVVPADVGDAPAMRDLIAGRDYLFNLAARVGHADSLRDPTRDLGVNAAAQLTLLDLCREASPAIRIVHTSTRQVYGRPDRLPVDERHARRPVDANGISKLAGESYVLLYHRVHGVRATVLRLTNTFGPHMHVRDARLNFLGAWIRALIEGRPFEVWGGGQVRDLTYVDDAVDACLAAALAPPTAAEGEVFNVGGSEPIALGALAELLVDLNGGGRFEVVPFPRDRRSIDIGDYATDDTKLRRALGWAPRVALRDGLARTLAFYRRHLAEYV